MPTPDARLLLLALSMAIGCNELGGDRTGLGMAACPEMGANVDALRAGFSADARANGKIATFLTASKDLVAVSTHIEAEVADTCRRIGTDLGIPPQQMAPRDEAGGQASGACAAVSA